MTPRGQGVGVLVLAVYHDVSALSTICLETVSNRATTKHGVVKLIYTRLHYINPVNIILRATPGLNTVT